MPVIVVFTKFDKMISRMEEELTDEELEETKDKIDSLCRERANTEFEKLCICPLKKVDRDLPSTGTSGSNSWPQHSFLTDIFMWFLSRD